MAHHSRPDCRDGPVALRRPGVALHLRAHAGAGKLCDDVKDCKRKELPNSLLVCQCTDVRGSEAEHAEVMQELLISQCVAMMSGKTQTTHICARTAPSMAA